MFYTVKPVSRGRLCKTKKKQPYVDLLKEVQLACNFLRQDKKNVTFEYSRLLNRDDRMGRFDYIYFLFPYVTYICYS